MSGVERSHNAKILFWGWTTNSCEKIFCPWKISFAINWIIGCISFLIACTKLFSSFSICLSCFLIAVTVPSLLKFIGTISYAEGNTPIYFNLLLFAYRNDNESFFLTPNNVLIKCSTVIPLKLVGNFFTFLLWISKHLIISCSNKMLGNSPT